MWIEYIHLAAFGLAMLMMGVCFGIGLCTWMFIDSEVKDESIHKH